MFCSKCGKQLNDSAKFCGGCGNPVKKIPAENQNQAAKPEEIKMPVFENDQGKSGSNQKKEPVVPSPPVVENTADLSAGRGLQYTIFGANLPGVSIKLGQGQSIYTQAGGMVWMDEGIQMDTSMKGGLMKGLGRKFTGESLFMVTYSSTGPNQEIVMASNFPGSIVGVELKGNAVIAQKTAFLCAQPDVEISTYMTKSLGAGFFGGGGFILQKLSGYGIVFLEIDGSLVERTLAPGEKIRVDTGNVAAFDESVQYQVETVKGFKNVMFGGEGLFLTTLTGPGKVWLQTMTLQGFARNIIPYIPRSGN